MTEAMIEKARENTEKLGFTNVEFVLGILKICQLENTADVVISAIVCLTLFLIKQKHSRRFSGF